MVCHSPNRSERDGRASRPPSGLPRPTKSSVLQIPETAPAGLSHRPDDDDARGRDPKAPACCDARFPGEYPVAPADQIRKGFALKAAE